VANQIDIARVTLNDAVDTAFLSGKEAIASMAEGDEQRLLFMGLKRFTKKDLYNTKEARRRIAAAMIEADEFVY
ncbi:MAG: acyl-CoA dehydrogenase, partial [Hymenobacteraceae bacterium]|nr:acyl-CoA dehydrogenase [Hymenobacteraceae bacterium]